MIDRDKKVGDLTVDELEKILSGFSYSFNPKYDMPTVINEVEEDEK